MQSLLRGAIFFSLILMAPSQNSYAANTMKRITSKKSAEDIAKKLPAPRTQDDFQVHSLGLGIGQTFLASGFRDYGDDKVTWDLLYDYSASYSFDMLVNFHMSSHKRPNSNDREIDLAGLAFGIKGKVFQFDSFSPFILGGLGFYYPALQRNQASSQSGGTPDNTVVKSSKKLTFGWHAGVGAELKLNPHFKMGLLGHFHNPFDIEQDAEFGKVDGHYFKLLVTGLYSFN